MQCPKCQSAMEEVTYVKHKVNRCTSCQGLWFRPRSFDELKTDNWMADYVLDTGKARVGRKNDTIVNVDCPECGTRMDQESDENQKHINYEVCPNDHGMFLDAGELSDLVHDTFWDKFKGLTSRRKE